MKEQHGGRGESRSLRERLTYANVMATLAFFAAIGGGAWAAVNVGRNDVTAREIAKNAVGTSELKNNKTKGKDVDESSLGEVPSAGRAGSATTAGTATTAQSATAAQSAAQLDGLAPASINAANLAFGPDTCDPGLTVVCASTQLDQPRTSDVLVIATATMFGNAGASGSCDVDGPGNSDLTGFAEIGQQQAIHDTVDFGDGFVVPGLFQDVPAGPSTFTLTCSQDSGEIKIGGQNIVAVRLSG